MAPSSANLVDMPLPRPVPPPVTSTTLSLKVSGGSIVLVLTGKCLAWGRGLYASLALHCRLVDRCRTISLAIFGLKFTIFISANNSG